MTTMSLVWKFKTKVHSPFSFIYITFKSMRITFLTETLKKTKLFQEVTSAMTPTQVNSFFKRKKKDNEAAAVILFLVGAAISTYDAVKDNQDNNKEYWTNKDEKKSIARDFVTTSTLLASDILINTARENRDAARTELTYLPKELFEKGVIYPGETYYGKVLFKSISVVKQYHRITNSPLKINTFTLILERLLGRKESFFMKKTIDHFHSTHLIS